MATLTLNAALGSGRKVTVTRSTSGSLSGSAALLIDNTLTDRLAVERLLAALMRAYDRAASKASKISGISTSGTSLD